MGTKVEAYGFHPRHGTPCLRAQLGLDPFVKSPQTHDSSSSTQDSRNPENLK